MSTWLSKRLNSCFCAHLLYEIVHMSRVVRLFPQDVRTCGDLLYQLLLLLPFGYLNALLDNIVPISVLHHLIEGPIQVFLLKATVQKLVNDLFFVFLTCVFQAFLHNIACEFVVTKLNGFSFDCSHNLILILLVLAVLQDMLNDIVTELILSQIVKVAQDLINDRS